MPLMARGSKSMTEPVTTPMHRTGGDHELGQLIGAGVEQVVVVSIVDWVRPAALTTQSRSAEGLDSARNRSPRPLDLCGIGLEKLRRSAGVAELGGEGVAGVGAAADYRHHRRAPDSCGGGDRRA